VVALRTRLQSASYDVSAEAFAVHADDSVRFPDVLVEPAQLNGKSLRAEGPILIAEVLSPGAYHLDFGDKLREYLTLPTLDTYLIGRATDLGLAAHRRRFSQGAGDRRET
jgi:Uma2 family endonuclease